MKLSFLNLKKRYKKVEALKGINGEFTHGIWGLLGPNGAGKTTFMRILVGNIKASEGEVLLDGVNIEAMGDSYRGKIGYLPQQFGYDKNQSVEGFLDYIGVLKGLEKKDRKRIIGELLRRFNLWEVRGRKVDKLSGGMKRRVGICQVMLNDPEIIIVDEPTAGLDIEERRRFRQYITSISKDRIVIISTHIVSDIEFISNYIMFMNNGEIVLSGERERLLDSEEVKVYEAEVSEKDVGEVEKKHTIVDYRNEGDGMVEIRFIANEDIAYGKRVKPTLKDLYLSKIKEEKPWKSSSMN